MRLDDQQRETIRKVTAALVGADARVRLFGSRLDDSRRGGDVDLLVEVPGRLEKRVRTEASLAARLERALGGRCVDVLLVDEATLLQSVHHVARQGVPVRRRRRRLSHGCGEKLGWLKSVDQWRAARKLRIRMIHEYVRRAEVLAAALSASHAAVPLLLAVTVAFAAEAKRRLPV